MTNFRFSQGQAVNVSAMATDLAPFAGEVLGQAIVDLPLMGAGWIVRCTDGTFPTATYPFDTLIVHGCFLSEQQVQTKLEPTGFDTYLERRMGDPEFAEAYRLAQGGTELKLQNRILEAKDSELRRMWTEVLSFWRILGLKAAQEGWTLQDAVPRQTWTQTTTEGGENFITLEWTCQHYLHQVEVSFQAGTDVRCWVTYGPNPKFGSFQGYPSDDFLQALRAAIMDGFIQGS